ncbi:sulfotransferase 6B1-like isoform X1 [Ambystoma mexicanum]|uniref:sulfotransferase 6B1-like isoform X1 n=1 Tax=Ambystoma mexicanum TaxID=8296 RepID=UPI0037E8AB20
MADDKRPMFDSFAKKAASMTPEELVFKHKGLLYPTLLCSLQTFQALEDTFRPRPDDAMLVAYPKCGFNWAMQLLNSMAALINNDVKAHQDKVIPILEFGKPDKFKIMEESPGPRVYGTHLIYDDIPQSFFVNKTKMLVVFRNPKDTAVSYFHFYNKNPLLAPFKSWDDFFPKFLSGEVLWGSYFDHAVLWNKHIDDPTVLLMTFEELKEVGTIFGPIPPTTSRVESTHSASMEDMAAGIKKISEFLEYSLTEEQIQCVAEGGTFSAMQEKYKTANPDFGKILLRKGEVGDWKNLFSEAQSKEIDAKFEQYLAGTALGNKLKYDVYCKF